MSTEPDGYDPGWDGQPSALEYLDALMHDVRRTPEALAAEEGLRERIEHLEARADEAERARQAARMRTIEVVRVLSNATELAIRVGEQFADDPGAQWAARTGALQGTINAAVERLSDGGTYE